MRLLQMAPDSAPKPQKSSADIHDLSQNGLRSVVVVVVVDAIFTHVSDHTQNSRCSSLGLNSGALTPESATPGVSATSPPYVYCMKVTRIC